MAEFCLRYAPNKIWYGVFSHLAAAGIVHGFSTRLGGVSDPPYASLNLGLRTNDAPANVIRNRQLFCQAVGVDPARTVTFRQVHGNRVAEVSKEMAGQGMFAYDETVPAADAMVTASSDVALLQFFADCVPVLLADPVRRVVAISHAGWRGTVAKVAQKTALFMHRAYGTNLADCLVGIGPSIGSCCYEVDAPVVEKVQEQFAAWRELLTPTGPGRWRLNLWRANRLQLQEIGIPSENIQESGVCTACNTTLYFSHRAEKGITGRIGALIALTSRGGLHAG